MDVGHRWRPIEQPADPRSLALDEIRAFAKFWQGQKSRLARRDALVRFEERMRRWWAIETGILERIYDLSLGATRLLVEHGFVASLLAHGESTLPPEQLVEILHDQREGLDMVMDVVAGTRSLSVSWIKELHALLTRHQMTVEARTPLGQLIEVPLEHGAFKRSPNNPERPDGIVHEYCPPEHVAAEMDRLVALYDQLPDDLPEVRAAWLHHAFTQIQPFQDGNGRVARALASIDFVKAGLFPVLIERDDKPVYLKALEDADAGDLRQLIALFGQAETRIITRAISEAEGAIDETASLTDIRQVAERKLATRRQVVDRFAMTCCVASADSW